VYDRLLLVLVKDAWNNRLGSDSEASVVNDDCAESVQAVDVKDIQGLDTLQVIDGRGVSSVVAAKVDVVVLDVEAQAEEHVVPDEHLNP